MRARELSGPQAFHAEGPMWWAPWALEAQNRGEDPLLGGLRYVDMLAGDVLTPLADGSVRRVHAGKVAAMIRPRGKSGAIVAVERAFALSTTSDLSDLQLMRDIWTDESIRFNDGGCDPMGNLYCGTMAYDQTPGAGILYRLGVDGMASPAVRNVTVSNGIGWSPSGALAYYNDTPTRTIQVFDWSPQNGLQNKRTWVTLSDKVTGSPDGLCVDQEGGVWVALYGGSAVHRYSADGVLSAVVELPVTNVTACSFGGMDMRTLFITTTRENVADGEQPLAGAVFTVRTDIGGLPVHPFGA